uniref:peptidyl-tRNA hydrolase n=1 Tax=Acrobeloides nanus TaxID=290746 RepID=A0A914D4R8_9BILA
MSKNVMYLILRSDLISLPDWTLGAVFTQIAHAATACIWTFRDDPNVIAYMMEMDSMHKVTLKVDDEDSLVKISERLKESNIDHKVWVEDNMPVCIAIKPQDRSKLKPIIGKLPLYK